MNLTNCPTCGQTVNRHASGHLSNVSQPYSRGQRYNRGPHSATCAGVNVFRSQEEALSAATKARETVRRYVAAFVTPGIAAGTVTPGEAGLLVVAAGTRLGVL